MLLSAVRFSVLVPQRYPGRELCEMQRDLHEEAQRRVLPWRSRHLTQASEGLASGPFVPLSVGQVWGGRGEAKMKEREG